MFSKLVRLGKDSELQTTKSSKQVCKIIAAYDVGWGDNKKTVWIEASLWGDRGSKISQYLTKGSQIVIHADDVEIDVYQSENGLKAKLKMNVINVELVARAQQNDGDYQQPKQQPQQPAMGGVDPEFDDDIPFN